MNKLFLFSIFLLTNATFGYSQSKPKTEYDKFHYMTRDLSRDIVAIQYVSVIALEKDHIRIRLVRILYYAQVKLYFQMIEKLKLVGFIQAKKRQLRF